MDESGKRFVWSSSTGSYWWRHNESMVSLCFSLCNADFVAVWFSPQPCSLQARVSLLQFHALLWQTAAQQVVGAAKQTSHHLFLGSNPAVELLCGLLLYIYIVYIMHHTRLFSFPMLHPSSAFFYFSLLLTFLKGIRVICRSWMQLLD